jgi:CRISPR system Cascade subunit CasD
MTTLLIRLQAPMQSWGISSHFSVRDTCREPTKSGVIGILCAAMGLTRDTPLDDFVKLKMGVRVDREGKLLKDYHIAQDILKASGGGIKASEPSNRYYLSDAVFLAGLEGSRSFLEAVQNALRHPRWPLFLGRKAFYPSMPLYVPDGLQETPLLDALKTYPCLVLPESDRLRAAIEDEEGTILRNDVPLSFSERRFSSRMVRMAYFEVPELVLEEAQHVSI